MGFFSASEKEQKSPVGRIPHCGACGLYKGCHTPKMKLAGDGRRKILVIGEAPGADEDRRGKPFIGDSGQMLQKGLKEGGIDLFRDCWVTNSVICRPPDNRDPTAEELNHCLPNLLKVIQDTKPRVMLLVGRFAITQVIGQLWDSGVSTGTRWLGYQIPSVEWNSWLCPVYHPAFITRKVQAGSTEGVIWHQHLKAVGNLRSRPWSDGLPNYQDKIRCIFDSRQAAAAVEDFIRSGGPVAFDYECNRLKPDHAEAQITSCSVSDGTYAISFPWVGEAVKAMRNLLWSTVPKIGWNIKFEERWTRRVFGKGVRNWLWDGMLATHVADNRQEITSLKFQAFVRLGIRSYDTKVSGYFRADSGNEENRIKEIDLRELLFYGGMDALCTAIIGFQQMKELKSESQVN